MDSLESLVQRWEKVGHHAIKQRNGIRGRLYLEVAAKLRSLMAELRRGEAGEFDWAQERILFEQEMHIPTTFNNHIWDGWLARAHLAARTGRQPTAEQKDYLCTQCGTKWTASELLPCPKCAESGVVLALAAPPTAPADARGIAWICEQYVKKCRFVTPEEAVQELERELNVRPLPPPPKEGK